MVNMISHAMRSVQQSRAVSLCSLECHRSGWTEHEQWSRFPLTEPGLQSFREDYDDVLSSKEFWGVGACLHNRRQVRTLDRRPLQGL